MSALTDYFTSLANKIRSKTGGSGTLTPTQMVSAVDDVYSAGQAHPVTQEKTADAFQSWSSIKTVTPDSGKFLSKVNIPKFLNGSTSDFNAKTFTEYPSVSGLGVVSFDSTGIYVLVHGGLGISSVDGRTTCNVLIDELLFNYYHDNGAVFYLIEVTATSQKLYVSFCAPYAEYIVFKVADL